MSSTNESNVQVSGADVVNLGRQTARTTFVFGAALVCLGFFAVMAPLFSGITVAVLAGMTLLVGGVVETLFAFRAPSFGKGALTFAFGGLGIAAGLVMMIWPGDGLGALTMLLAAYFLAAGSVDAFLAFKLKPEEGWGWALFSGLLSMGLGIFIFAQWPVSGVFAVGIYVGIRLLMHGCMMMALGVAGGDALEYGQDTRIEILEGHVRSGMQALQEAQLAIVVQMGVLIALDQELRQKVSASSVDPAIQELNNHLGEAREAMKRAAEAGSEAWGIAQQEANETFQKLRAQADEATAALRRDLGVDPT